MPSATKKPAYREASIKAKNPALIGDDTLFETPALGVFITRTGEIRRGALASEKIRPLEDLAAVLKSSTSPKHQLHLFDTPIHTLANTGDPDLALWLGLSKEYADALKLVAQAISTISIIGTAISIAITALEWLGLFGEEENPYDVIYTKIEAHLKATLRTTLAGQTLNTMQEINQLVSHSETAAKAAAAYRLKPSPARESLLPLADYWSQYALNALRGEPMWLRTYDADVARIPPGGVSNWTIGPTVAPNLLMWDWRLPLLAYLKALTARIAVIHTIDPGIDAVHRAEILSHATFLQAVEQRIRSGFSVAIPIPDPGYAHWTIAARDACGVIDVHSGAADVAWVFVPHYWWRDPIDTAYFYAKGLPTTYDEYRKWHFHSQGIRYWRLYDSLGLFSLWSIVPDVQTAAKGKPGFATAKAILEKNFDLTKLTEMTGPSKKRVKAFTEWSEHSRQSARDVEAP